MKTYLIDLDGTMYSGNENIDGAKEFIHYLIETNQQFLFVTNNAMRTHKQNKEHMEALGFKGIKEEHFFTSSMASTRYVAKMSDKRKVFMIGAEGLKEALLEQNFEFVKDDEIADFVFVGLTKEGTYASYSKALDHLMKGAKLIGTNNDRKLPSGKNQYMLGNGAIVAMLEYASQQKTINIGKPYEPMLSEALDFIHKSKNEVIMVGDNLETDIAFGANYGVETIFVSTGVHTFEDVEKSDIKPTYMIHNLKELMK